MINRNLGGSIIKKSTDMNKFQKLAQLNKDIELLETAGKFKAAEILQKKFIKEAQAQNNAFGGLVTQDAKNAMMQMDSAYNNGKIQLIPGILQNVANTEATPAEQQILKAHANKLMSQRMDENRSQYKGYETPQDNIAPSTQAPLGQTDNFKNHFTDQSDTENFVQQQNSNPNAQQESNEQRIYMNALNDIILAFSQNDKNTGEAIFNKTLQQITNPKRKKAFSDQIQRQRTKYFAGKYNQGPTR